MELMWSLYVLEEEVDLTLGEIIQYGPLVMSGIHGHRRDLAHARLWPRGLLRGSSAHQGGERRATLHECVQSFLDTRAVKIDT